jgi:hypothetical protein
VTYSTHAVDSLYICNLHIYVKRALEVWIFLIFVLSLRDALEIAASRSRTHVCEAYDAEIKRDSSLSTESIVSGDYLIWSTGARNRPYVFVHFLSYKANQMTFERSPRSAAAASSSSRRNVFMQSLYY